MIKQSIIQSALRQIAFLVLIMAPELLQAQDQAVTWTDDYRSQRRENVIRMIGASGSDFYVYKRISGRDPHHTIQRFDRSTMKVKSSADIQLPEIDGEQTELHDLFLVDGRLLLLSMLTERRSDRKFLYGTWLNPDGTLNDIPALMGEMTVKRQTENQTFGVQLAVDSSMILIYNESTLDRRANERFSFRVVDLNLETVWKKELELPYRSELLEINQYLLDSHGRLYMMSGIEADKRDNAQNEKRLSEKRYVLVTYDPSQNKVKEFEVDLGDKWVISTTFAIDEDGDLAIGGFYSNDRHFSIAGSFYFRIDEESREVEAKNLESFSTEFRKQFMSDRRAERGDELNDFYFDHLITRKGGGATLVAEQYYVISRYRSDITTGRQEIINDYHYNDLILIDFAPSGEQNWTVRVPKEQITSNDRGPYSSYAITATQDSIFLLFNDDPANQALLEKDPNASPRTFNSVKRSVVSRVSIGTDGKQHRRQIFTSKEEQTIIKPKVHISPSQGELFIFALFRRQYRFGRLEF